MWSAWIDRIARHRYFLLFILLFAYVESIYMRMAVRREINAYTFTPEAALVISGQAAILFAIIRYFIRKWEKPATFSLGSLLKVAGLSLITYLFLMKLLGLIVALLFNRVEQNFDRQTFILSLFSDLLDGFIYGSFYLAYSYYNRSREQQRKEASYRQLLSESNIQQLKAQLNPHFLFNNLNVLDQLIEEDQQKASSFLNKFADIYRFVLQASDKKLVSLKDELDFARQYVSLMQYKYPDSYQVQIDQDRVYGYIVPLALQLLIENVFQHNLGTAGNPVVVRIQVAEDILVSNNINRKRSCKTTSGRALKNLQEQYRLLTNEPVVISSTAEIFSVRIPIIERTIYETHSDH